MLIFQIQAYVSITNGQGTAGEKKTGLFFFPFSFSDSSEVRTEVKMRSNDSLLLESIREQGKRGKGLCASSPS